MEKRKMIIDCDTGTDDAIALVAALYSPDVDLRAITTVKGNVALKYTSHNSLNLVSYFGFNTPVAVGAVGPLKERGVHVPSGTHGQEGLGGVMLPVSNAAFYEKNAIDTIYDEALKAKGELELVAVGPLTNVAIAFLLYPDLKDLLKHIWIMGGAVSGGNMNHNAEFNIWSDPEAARITFHAGVPCTMVGLDVTEKAIMNEDDAAKLRALNTKAGNFVADILDFMFKRRDEGGEDALMHDALALASALAPTCVSCEPYYVDVECEGTYSYGHTFVDTSNKLKKTPNVQVAMKLNLPVFKAWLYDCVKNSVR